MNNDDPFVLKKTYTQAPTPIVWAQHHIELLGAMADAKLAKQMGVSTTVVFDKRKEFNIPSYFPFRGGAPGCAGKKGIVWISIDPFLGKMSDEKVGRMFNLACSTIWSRRKALGIAPWLKVREKTVPTLTVGTGICSKGHAPNWSTTITRSCKTCKSEYDKEYRKNQINKKGGNHDQRQRGSGL